MLRGRLAKRDSSSSSLSSGSICAFCRYRLSLLLLPRRRPGLLPPQQQQHRLFSASTQCADDHKANSSSSRSSFRPPASALSKLPFGNRPLDRIVDPHEARARERLLAQQAAQRLKETSWASRLPQTKSSAPRLISQESYERDAKSLADRASLVNPFAFRRVERRPDPPIRKLPARPPLPSRADSLPSLRQPGLASVRAPAEPAASPLSNLTGNSAFWHPVAANASAKPPPTNSPPIDSTPTNSPTTNLSPTPPVGAAGSGFDALEEAGARDAKIKSSAKGGLASFGASEEWGQLTRKTSGNRHLANDAWGSVQGNAIGPQAGRAGQPDPWATTKTNPILDTPVSPAPSRSIDLPRPTSRGRDDGHDREKNKRREIFDWGETQDKKRGGGGSRGKRSQRASRFEEDDEEGDTYERYQEKRRQKELRKAQREADRTEPIPIILPELIGVTAFAKALKIQPEDFLVQLGELGFEGVTLDSLMAGETAALVAQEYGYEPTVEAGDSLDLKPRPPPEDPSVLPSRPPVVTIMGHVDHGKTTILDYLRKSSVAAQEHGGITQHIGAFSVRLSSGKPITFLDTPGHAAFLTMRQRGAHVTDIVVLVVAADDSVKPQTLEALKHARAAKVPIIVAINKIDKDGARIDAVKHDLANAGVEIEDFGGDVQVVCVSGKTGQGMDDLEENILTLSEILDHRSEFDGPAEGWILESSLKPTGKVATVLVKRGTLRPGDYIAAGLTWAKIRQLRNEAGVDIEEASPGTPVEILGWKDLPAAGDQVIQSPDEEKAKRAVSYREGLRDREKDAADYEVITEARKVLEEKRAREKAANEGDTGGTRGTGVQELLPDEENGTKLINFAVKADVHGSVEAVCAAIQEIGSHEVRPRVLRSATGPITEFDVEHAAMSKSVIVNFATTTPGYIRHMAETQGVRILDHTVIYHLVDDVKANLSSYLTPDVSTRVLGEAEVLQVFPINLRGRVYKNIAGCRVRNGVVGKNNLYRVMRKGEVVFEGKLETLKHVKKDVMEMRKGTECGMGFEEFQDLEVGDQIQAYEEVRTSRTL
ncbi:translation initiation factor IF-2 [Nemania abortiva]|nr:translation initiation factor IF-2 [Nemania abortiva]